MKKLLYVFIAVSIFSSCIKDEIPVPAHAEGDVTTNEINLGIDYRYQAYYDFGTNSFVKQHLKTDWDIGFETGIDGWRVILNTSKAMSAAANPIANFSTVTDTIGAVWKYDLNSGDLDSTALGDWQNSNSFYIINRGYSYDGVHQGFRKFDIISVDANEYEIHYSNLDGTNETTMIIEKDEAYNFTFLSFESNSAIEIQPEKNTWDLVFGQYAHLFEPTFPYLVTGVLSSRNGVEIAEVYDKPFDEIKYADVSNYPFSSDIDIIGYDWKTYAGGTYVTHLEQNYLVKTTEGFYYKIHFIDFYNQFGDKGNPKFEVQQL
ncbi:MAG: HmuY family protein [Crocinitomicaceae bacterium]|nr:HmuY family protein [Crocinitomicaceae bacterium]